VHEKSFAITHLAVSDLNTFYTIYWVYKTNIIHPSAQTYVYHVLMWSGVAGRCLMIWTELRGLWFIVLQLVQDASECFHGPISWDQECSLTRCEKLNILLEN